LHHSAQHDGGRIYCQLWMKSQFNYDCTNELVFHCPSNPVKQIWRETRDSQQHLIGEEPLGADRSSHPIPMGQLGLKDGLNWLSLPLNIICLFLLVQFFLCF
jgi:hypothetical protein